MVARLDPRVVFLQNSFGDSTSLDDATCREAEAKGLGFNLCDDVVWGDGLHLYGEELLSSWEQLSLSCCGRPTLSGGRDAPSPAR